MIKKRLFPLLFILATTLAAHAYTTVEGFYGETWLDHVDEDGFGGGNFGDGSESNPWQIRSAGALAYLARAVNREGETYAGKYFVIAANINMAVPGANGMPLVWVPIGCTTNPSSDNAPTFKGTLKNGADANGKPYEITGMTIRATSTATTTCFGLFGALRGTVDGLVLRNAEIDTEGISGEYFAGTICGYLGKSSPVNITTRYGAIRNCTVEQTTIEAESDNKSTGIGGLVGLAELDLNELAHNVAKTTMRLTGPMKAGGVVGEAWWNLLDCHAVVDMSINNTSANDCRVGGVAGYTSCWVSTLSPDKIITMKCCTSSGEIKGSGSNIMMGGIIGDARYYLTMTACTTCTALSGGYTMGGLIGNAYSMSGNDGMMVEECYCSSYVDGTAATYAGGLFGYVEYNFRASNHSITPNDNLRFSYFAGTMKKPANSERYGTIVGYADGYERSGYLKFGYFKRDYRQCNLQTNSNGWVDDGDDLALATYFTPRPVDGDFRFDRNAERPQVYIYSEGRDLFYTDNMRLAGTPFNVTGDGQAFFDLWDATVDFQIGTFKNRSTQEEIATFTLPLPPACVEVQENVVKLLDPGEADVYVNYKGLQRKVHLTLTYGLPWDYQSVPLNYNDYFAGGDGTAKNPYVIHNVPELIRVMANSPENDTPEAYRYNVAGKHYILANDLFFNTHLLGEDEQPKADAQTFTPNHPWHATLHGNGKTIYGLCIKKEDITDNANLGLITTLDGTVTDLAIVDSYIRAGIASEGSMEINAGMLCGKLYGGTIERCMTHGLVQADGYAGGICGQATGDGGRIADCFTGVHIGWANSQSLFHGAGIAYNSTAAVQRCVSTGKIEDGSYNLVYGITETEVNCTDSWFDRQMMSGNVMTEGYALTKDIISGQILTNAAAWQNGEQRYPMLRQFAKTPYGDLLSMAVRFDDGDRAGSITKIFEFPTENVSWRARCDGQYLDVINECGAGTPNGKTGDVTEHLLAESTDVKSLCTKALRALAVNVRADKAGIAFADQNVKTAALTAFDTDGDQLVTLREAFEATPERFATFNQAATQAVTFNELRYFAGFSTLQTGMISGLQSLSEVTLPPSVTTIATNAFLGCTSLDEVELPAKFATLQQGGFYGSGIKNILVAEKNAQCRSIGGALYKIDTNDDDKVMLMAYPPGRGQADATLSAPLSAIMPYAIYKVPALRNVYIDNCLPEGEMAVLEKDGIIHEDADELIHVYVNDGSFNSQLFLDYYNDDTWYELYFDKGCLDIYYPLNVTSALWATLYIDFSTELPEGLTAYIADYPNEDEKTVELHSIGRIVPRSTPVAIKAAQPGLYPLYKFDGQVPDVSKWKNRFIGSFIGQDNRWGVPVNQETADEGSILTLGRNANGEVGFYKYNGTLIPPYRAYLTRNNIIEGDAIRIGNALVEEPDAIAAPSAADASVAMRWHTLDGRRLSGRPSRPGLYIINGKKTIIK